MSVGWRIAMVVIVLSLSGVGWLLLQRHRGWLRPPRREGRLPDVWADHAGSVLTIVQLSSRACSACVRSAQVWRSVIDDVRGASFVEVDAAEHLDLVRELGVLSTPTTLVYDADRVLRARVDGAPRPQDAATLVTEPMGALR